jgi:transcriptional regulator with XRE-family HTH domain
MTEQLVEIGRRLSDLRKIMEFSAKTLAEKLGVDEQTLLDFEQGKRDFSFSFLHNAAQVLGVDVIDLLTGDSPRLSTAAVVRRGEGLSVDRRAAYSYKHLAFTFRDKLSEPFLVTVEPKDEEPVLHAHEGQEFNYILSGRMRLYLENISYELSAGDSLYFNAAVPHAMRALDNQPTQFLAVVMNQ